MSEAPLILNSFTKSYILDKAARAALAAGPATAVVVNIGGHIVVRGAITESVDIADPRSPADNAPPLERLEVRGRAVATSGVYRRGFDIAGRHYSHIVDPRTGQPAGHILSATVVAPNATDAGALATTMSVLTSDESRRLAATVPGAEYLLIARNGARIASPGWSDIAAAMQTAASRELEVQFELALINGQRYRRPFVAVWIEDKDRFPVRTVALWFDKARWLPGLKTWYRDDRLRPWPKAPTSPVPCRAPRARPANTPFASKPRAITAPIRFCAGRSISPALPRTSISPAIQKWRRHP